MMTSLGLPDAPRLAAMYSKLHTLITTPPTQLLLSDVLQLLLLLLLVENTKS